MKNKLKKENQYKKPLITKNELFDLVLDGWGKTHKSVFFDSDFFFFFLYIII